MWVWAWVYACACACTCVSCNYYFRYFSRIKKENTASGDNHSLHKTKTEPLLQAAAESLYTRWKGEQACSKSENTLREFLCLRFR